MTDQAAAEVVNEITEGRHGLQTTCRAFGSKEKANPNAIGLDDPDARQALHEMLPEIRVVVAYAREAIMAVRCFNLRSTNLKNDRFWGD